MRVALLMVPEMVASKVVMAGTWITNPHVIHKFSNFIVSGEFMSITLL